jgi:hypothetical protein
MALVFAGVVYGLAPAWSGALSRRALQLIRFDA